MFPGSSDVGGGWGSLRAVLADRDNGSDRPASCPYCGEPYRLDIDGAPTCVFDGYTPAGPRLPTGRAEMRDWGGLGVVLSTVDRPAVGSQCPHDGTTLRPGPDGRLHCPFDGWTGTEAQAAVRGPALAATSTAAGYGLTPYGTGPYGE